MLSLAISLRIEGGRNLLLDAKQVSQRASKLEDKLDPMARHDGVREIVQAEDIMMKQVYDCLGVDFDGGGDIMSHFA